MSRDSNNERMGRKVRATRNNVAMSEKRLMGGLSQLFV